jgi:hypothetical protein
MEFSLYVVWQGLQGMLLMSSTGILLYMHAQYKILVW